MAKHKLDDATCTRAVAMLADLLQQWRADRAKLRSPGRMGVYDNVIFAAEVALQALGADPDGPDTQPPVK